MQWSMVHSVSFKDGTENGFCFGVVILFVLLWFCFLLCHRRKGEKDFGVIVPVISFFCLFWFWIWFWFFVLPPPIRQQPLICIDIRWTQSSRCRRGKLPFKEIMALTIVDNGQTLSFLPYYPTQYQLPTQFRIAWGAINKQKESQQNRCFYWVGAWV